MLATAAEGVVKWLDMVAQDRTARGLPDFPIHERQLLEDRRTEAAAPPKKPARKPRKTRRKRRRAGASDSDSDEAAAAPPKRPKGSSSAKPSSPSVRPVDAQQQAEDATKREALKQPAATWQGWPLPPALPSLCPVGCRLV